MNEKRNEKRIIGSGPGWTPRVMEFEVSENGQAVAVIETAVRVYRGSDTEPCRVEWEFRPWPVERVMRQLYLHPTWSDDVPTAPGYYRAVAHVENTVNGPRWWWKIEPLDRKPQPVRLADVLETAEALLPDLVGADVAARVLSGEGSARDWKRVRKYLRVLTDATDQVTAAPRSLIWSVLWRRF